MQTHNKREESSVLRYLRKLPCLGGERTSKIIKTKQDTTEEQQLSPVRSLSVSASQIRDSISDIDTASECHMECSSHNSDELTDGSNPEAHIIYPFHNAIHRDGLQKASLVALSNAIHSGKYGDIDRIIYRSLDIMGREIDIEMPKSSVEKVIAYCNDTSYAGSSTQDVNTALEVKKTDDNQRNHTVYDLGLFGEISTDEAVPLKYTEPAHKSDVDQYSLLDLPQSIFEKTDSNNLFSFANKVSGTENIFDASNNLGIGLFHSVHSQNMSKFNTVENVQLAKTFKGLKATASSSTPPQADDFYITQGTESYPPITKVKDIDVRDEIPQISEYTQKQQGILPKFWNADYIWPLNIKSGEKEITLPQEPYFYTVKSNPSDKNDQRTTLVMFGYQKDTLCDSTAKTAKQNDLLMMLDDGVKKAKQAGYFPILGLEPEFFVYKKDQHVLMPFSEGYDILLKDIAQSLRKQGIPARMSGHHKEVGAGIYELKLAPIKAETAPVMLNALKNIIHNTAQSHGLIADFSTKPTKEGISIALHHNISFCDNMGYNMFSDYKGHETDIFKASVIGLLDHAYSLQAIATGSHQSLDQFSDREDYFASSGISCSESRGKSTFNKRALSKDAVRIESRFPDWSSPPLTSFALVAAMMDGINNYLDDNKCLTQDGQEKDSNRGELMSTMYMNSFDGWQSLVNNGLKKDKDYLTQYANLSQEVIEQFADDALALAEGSKSDIRPIKPKYRSFEAIKGNLPNTPRSMHIKTHPDYRDISMLFNLMRARNSHQVLVHHNKNEESVQDRALCFPFDKKYIDTYTTQDEMPSRDDIAFLKHNEEGAKLLSSHIGKQTCLFLEKVAEQYPEYLSPQCLQGAVADISCGTAGYLRETASKDKVGIDSRKILLNFAKKWDENNQELYYSDVTECAHQLQKPRQFIHLSSPPVTSDDHGFFANYFKEIYDMIDHTHSDSRMFIGLPVSEQKLVNYLTGDSKTCMPEHKDFVNELRDNFDIVASFTPGKKDFDGHAPQDRLIADAFAVGLILKPKLSKPN